MHVESCPSSRADDSADVQKHAVPSGFLPADAFHVVNFRDESRVSPALCSTNETMAKPIEATSTARRAPTRIMDWRDLPEPPPGASGWPWTAAASTTVSPRAPSIAWPRISIVIPSLNQWQYLEQTLRSILLQNYPEVEILLMDG